MNIKAAILASILFCSTVSATETPQHTREDRGAIVGYLFELTKLDLDSFTGGDAYTQALMKAAVTPPDLEELKMQLAEPVLSDLSDEEISQAIAFIRSPDGQKMRGLANESATTAEAIQKARGLPAEERSRIQSFFGSPAFQKLGKSINTPGTREAGYEWGEQVLCRYFNSPAAASRPRAEREEMKQVCRK